MSLAVTASVVGIAAAGYSIYQSSQMGKAGQAAINASDPFGAYRGQYGAELSNLMANPSAALTDPGFKANFQFGLDSTNRELAAGGQWGGNQAKGLFDYAQSSLGTYEQWLANLAGAGTVPNATGAGLAAIGAGNAGVQGGLNQLGAVLRTIGNNPSSTTNYNPWAPNASTGYGTYTPTSAAAGTYGGAFDG